MKITIKQLKQMIIETLTEDDQSGLKLGLKRKNALPSKQFHPNMKSDGDDNWNDSLDTSDPSDGLKDKRYSMKETECGCSSMDEDEGLDVNLGRVKPQLKPKDPRRRPTHIMQPGEVDMEDTFSNRGLKRRDSSEDWYLDPVSSKPVDRLSLDNQERDKFHNMKESEEDMDESELDEAELDEMGNRKGFDFADCIRSLRGQSLNPEEDCRKKQRQAMGTSRGR